MKHHLLISTIIDSFICFSDIIVNLESQFTRKLSCYSFSKFSFYEVNVEELTLKLNHLRDLFKDKNLHVKSNPLIYQLIESEKIRKNEVLSQRLHLCKNHFMQTVY
jgi:hypothetical protein